MNNMLVYKIFLIGYTGLRNEYPTSIGFILNSINASFTRPIGLGFWGRFLFTGFESRRIPSYPKVNMSVYRYLKLCHLPTVDALSAY